MTKKFYNDMFGDKHQPKGLPWMPDKPKWPTQEEQAEYWRNRYEHADQMHRCPECGCLFTGGEE